MLSLNYSLRYLHGVTDHLCHFFATKTSNHAIFDIQLSKTGEKACEYFQSHSEEEESGRGYQ